MATDFITRANAEALIPEEVTTQIVQGAVAQSAVLSLFKKLPNMASNRQSMPVLDMLPIAYWVNGDTGQKKTTKMLWDKKYIYAEEIAVIVPIPEAVLNDAQDNGYDIWGEVLPRISEAFGKAIDDAILFDVSKPTTWREGVVNTAIRAGNVVNAASPTPDIFGEIFGENGVIAEVEVDGFMPNGIISAVTMRGKLRGLRDDNNKPLYVGDMKGTTPYALDGMPMFFLQNGAWDNDKCSMIVGDMGQAVYSIRQDITYKILTEGVIQDSEGTIVYNLAQQDMVALRVVMRLGWEIPNPINALSSDKELRCPFAVYNPNGAAIPTIGVLAGTSVAGTATGDTKVTVTGTSGGTLFYKTGASQTLPVLNQATTGYTAWDGIADITATTGHKMAVAEVKDGVIKKAVLLTVASKAGA
jgi:HK97 family phage major capsid protein